MVTSIHGKRCIYHTLISALVVEFNLCKVGFSGTVSSTSKAHAECKKSQEVQPPTVLQLVEVVDAFVFQVGPFAQSL